MEPQSIFNIIQLLLVLVLGLVFLNLYLVFRLKNFDPFAKWNPNSINGGLFFLFYIVGMIAAIWSTAVWYDKMILMHSAASEHGVWIDSMMFWTMVISILVVIITNFLLFYYCWRYSGKEGRKAFYYSHNNTLEYIWTAVPAVVMAALIIVGIMNWHKIMGNPPEEAIQMEVVGKQFAWTYRFPGPDMEFGETNVRFIEAGNDLGFNWKDENGHDDIVSAIVTDTILFPVNTPINLRIRSQDVLHSATLAHFRVKMDAVPGMPTSFYFTPTITTDEMRQRTGNSKFNFEMSCQQICGGSHYNMRRVIKVVTRAEYDRWMGQQKPFMQAGSRARELQKISIQIILQKRIQIQSWKKMK